MIHINRRLKILFHSLGLAWLGGAVFLQVLVFYDITIKGYFIAVEGNKAIVSFEIALTAFTIIYFAYAYCRLIRHI